ncbi:polymer-forming cytoskeletal protein [Candidatus Poribacteria bacterium]|nr:polymer-forming cytoskeletal protein [Candidatus Poribacteria bacterium]
MGKSSKWNLHIYIISISYHIKFKRICQEKPKSTFEKELTPTVFLSIIDTDIIQNYRDTFLFILMNMKRIGFILFTIIFLGVQPLFGQLTDPQTEPSPPSTQEGSVENDEQNTELVSPSTPEKPSTIREEEDVESEKQDTENASPSATPEEISIDSDKQDVIPIIEKAETEEPLDAPNPALPKWEGRRRLFKIVNDYQLKADEAVTTLVLIAGDATIHGTVTGNVLVIGGDVMIAPGARVKGMLQVIGGQITGNLESVANVSVSNHWRILPATADLLMRPHTLWDLRKHRNFRLTTMKFALLLLAYLLIALVFPRPITAISSLLTRRPIESILFGILMFIVIPIVFVVLILSIVGYPLLLLSICLLVPLALYGKTAIFYTLGSTLLAGRLKPLAVIFGFIPYFMATEIPHLNWIVFLIFNGMGISLCILAALSAMSSQNQGKNTHWSERVR